MLVTGLGPTSERVDGRVQAWTRLALDSFKGSNPVWRATGHNEPVDGRVQTWTRHRRAIIPRTDGQRPKDRSVIFNPQGWETDFFSRFPARYPGRRLYGSTQWYCLFVFPFVPTFFTVVLDFVVYASSTSTLPGP